MSDALTITSEHLTATVSPHGARLETLRFQDSASLILHADHPNWRGVYPGAIVGPVANRVQNGTCVIDGQTHQMPCNENGITALHSGPDGLDQRIWSVIDHTNTTVHLQIALSDGDVGLPGARSIDVIYTAKGATLTLSITATTDAPTPINIAHHPYWRLGDTRTHCLQIAASHYLPVDDLNVPTGDVTPVAGTVFDHTTPKALDAKVDHNFCISTAQRDTPRRLATLAGADGLVLDIASTEPGLQVYAGAYLPTLPGTDIKPYAGIALEPQGWPDAINRDDFPPILCTPDRPYRQITRYSIRRAT